MGWGTSLGVAILFLHSYDTRPAPFLQWCAAYQPPLMPPEPPEEPLSQPPPLEPPSQLPPPPEEPLEPLFQPPPEPLPEEPPLFLEPPPDQLPPEPDIFEEPEPLQPLPEDQPELPLRLVDIVQPPPPQLELPLIMPPLDHVEPLSMCQDQLPMRPFQDQRPEFQPIGQPCFVHCP